MTEAVRPANRNAIGSTIGNSIGNHIRRLRFEHNEMTQEGLAQATGITRQTVIALEALRYAPSLDLAMKIAEVFGQKVDAVFFRQQATIKK